MLKEGHDMSADEGQEEYEEVQADLRRREEEHEKDPELGGPAGVSGGNRWEYAFWPADTDRQGNKGPKHERKKQNDQRKLDDYNNRNKKLTDKIWQVQQHYSELQKKRTRAFLVLNPDPSQLSLKQI